MSVRVLRSRSAKAAEVVKPVKRKVEPINVESVKKAKKEVKAPVGELRYFSSVAPLTDRLPEVFVSAHDDKLIQGIRYILSKDPTLFDIVTAKNFPVYEVGAVAEAVRTKNDNQPYFAKLASGIISQQISGKAADAIRGKLNAALGSPFTYEAILAADFDTLRGCGLSVRKVEYITGLAEKFASGELNAKFFQDSTDSDIADRLIDIRGIGPWSVTMFMIFQLRRLDYFEIRDLGIVRGGSKYLLERPEMFKEIKERHTLAKKTAHIVNAKKNIKWTAVDEGYVEHLAEQFKPYRSILMFILWRISDTQIETLET